MMPDPRRRGFVAAGERHRRRATGKDLHLALVVLWSLAGPAHPVVAQEEPGPPQEVSGSARPAEAKKPIEPTEVTAPTESGEAEGGGTAAGAVPAKVPDPCALKRDKEGNWLDRTHDHVGWTVCRAALWFDGLFGQDRVYEERDATFGWVQPSLTWDDIDGLDPGLRFRAKVSLPHLERRVHALFGRSDLQTFSDDSTDTVEPPLAFREVDEDWLVGLGYTPVRGARRRFDFDAGLELQAPLEGFVQGRYRRQWFPSERSLIRLRQTLFWHTEDGLGTSMRLDLERLLGSRFFIRWRAGGRVAEYVEGVEWLGEIVLYHELDDRQALAYRISGSGESRVEPPDGRYDLGVTYRRRFLREWLFYELRPGVSWRRAEGELERQLTPVLGVGIELQFGNWPK